MVALGRLVPLAPLVRLVLLVRRDQKARKALPACKDLAAEPALRVRQSACLCVRAFVHVYATLTQNDFANGCVQTKSCVMTHTALIHCMRSVVLWLSQATEV